MPILAVVTREAEALPLIRWAMHCALAREENVLVIHPAQGGGMQTDNKTTELDLIGDPPDDPVDRAIIAAAHQTIRAQLGHADDGPETLNTNERAAIGCPIITARRIADRAPTAAVLDRSANSPRA